jgi:hypothetical protein
MKINFYYKILTLSVALFFTISLNAQSDTKSSSPDIKKISGDKKETIRTVNDLKTGNWQDVLTSFFQLGLSDLTGAAKTLNFKANLFALKVKADSNLLIDRHYKKQTFARNFQFDFGLKLDSSYKFKGFNSGFTWAVINKRDSSVASFINTKLDEFYGNSQVAISDALDNFTKSLYDIGDTAMSTKNLEHYKKVKTQIDEIQDKGYFVPANRFPKEFIPFISQEYAKNLKEAEKGFNEEMEKLRTKPLMTLSVNTSFENKERSFNNGSAQLIYLQGIKSKRAKTEIDIRAFASIKDTTVVKTERRSIFKSTAGINFTLLQVDGKSIIEFKPHMEYNAILSKPYASEEKSVFLANADFRLRIFDNFWLPLTIKYDIENSNFLGFLDIAVNMDVLKSKK